MLTIYYFHFQTPNSDINSHAFGFSALRAHTAVIGLKPSKCLKCGNSGWSAAIINGFQEKVNTLDYKRLKTRFTFQSWKKLSKVNIIPLAEHEIEMFVFNFLFCHIGQFILKLKTEKKLDGYVWVGQKLKFFIFF